MAGINIPENTKVIVVYQTGVGDDHPFSKEKLSPVLAYYLVKNSREGIDLADALIRYGGMGHSAVIHSEDRNIIRRFAEVIKAGRVLVNSPSTHGGIGDIYNTNLPSLTLGCGTFGGNSTTDNVSSVNLINVKRVAKGGLICSGLKFLKKYILKLVQLGIWRKCLILQKHLL